MIADKVALRVTPSQHRRLARWAECARLTYNWALSEWRRQYADYREAHEASTDPDAVPPKPSANGLVHLFTVLRQAGRLPSWAQEPLALTRNRAVRDVDLAWRNYFAGRAGRPRRKRRSEPPSFYLHNQSVRFEGLFAKVQKIGPLRLAHTPRYPKHPVVSATVSYEHGRWHIAIVRNLARQRQRSPAGVLGLQVGVKIAAASDGATLRTDVMTDAERRRLRRLERTLSRRGNEAEHGRMRAVRGGRAVRVSLSRNRIKAVQRLNTFRGRIGRRLAAQRHVFTRSLAARATILGVQKVASERRPPGGGAGRRGANRVLGDGLWSEVRRQLEYKLPEHGGRLVAVDAVPATDCAACGARTGPRGPDRPESRLWTCGSCGAVQDRDLSAAVQVARQAAASCVSTGTGDAGATPGG